MNKYRQYYVTIQLSNGGIESLFLDLDNEELACPEVFESKIRDYWDMNCPHFSEIDKYINMHLISWSLIEG